METTQLLTKNCIDPWKSLLFGVDGTIIPCCGSPLPEGDFGNINCIDFDLPATDASRAVFANDAYINLRRQLLDGTLQEACEGCRVVSEYVPLDFFRKRVVAHLRYGGRILTDSTDLSSEYVFTNCMTNVTDKCNFSCIYCFVHSNDRPGDGIRNYPEVSREHFLKIVSFLAANGLEYLNFCGVGELTIYPHWQELCRELFTKYPGIRLSLVTNFGRKLSDDDLDVLSQFFQIRISCDTLNPEKYSWLRPGGRLPVLQENVNRLMTRFNEGANNPKLFFVITESDAMLDGVTDLARFAVERNISLYFSNLSLVEGSVAATVNCLKKIVDIPDAQICSAWELIHDLPRRIRAAHPPMDFICDLGPLYDAVRSRAEAITLNRFVPYEGEVVYKAFAAAHPVHPDMFLRKLFLSFDVCVKGIFIRSGLTADVNLPYSAGILKFRIIWCKEVAGKSFSIYMGDAKTVVVDSKLPLSAVKCPARFTHMLFEILSYDPCEEDKPVTTKLDFSVRISPFSPLVTISEFSDQRYEFAMAVSDFLKAYPGIHKFAENIYRRGIRLLSRIRKG